MKSRHYAPPPFRQLVIYFVVPPCRHAAILAFHKSVPISRNYCISYLISTMLMSIVRCKENHLCTPPVVFGVTDLCLLRKPNISYLDIARCICYVAAFCARCNALGSACKFMMSTNLQCCFWLVVLYYYDIGRMAED